MRSTVLVWPVEATAGPATTAKVGRRLGPSSIKANPSWGGDAKLWAL